VAEDEEEGSRVIEMRASHNSQVRVWSFDKPKKRRRANEVLSNDFIGGLKEGRLRSLREIGDTGIQVIAIVEISGFGCLHHS